jgi:hypothetical protein
MDNAAQAPINLATLPRKEAMRIAHDAGRAAYFDPEIVEAITLQWIDRCMPISIDQSDDEFEQLSQILMTEFKRGLAAFVGDRRASDALRESIAAVTKELQIATSHAWRIHNVLAFMTEALPDDKVGELPVRCTVTDLRCDMDALATKLMDLEVAGA